jgi:ParB/RepB/Spo0J family partition protein
MNELKFIPLSDITMLTNYRDVEPVNEKDADIKELSESIAKHGVMQPILVRPNKKAGHYELIFGHRRFVACKVAKLATIPANVKPVSDEEILEYQVTENLQRKDVHPMDEAIAFHSLVVKKNYSVDEIAARFAKKPEFITQRLKLVDLVPDAQKLFKQNKLLVGHAILLARLTPEDQNSIIKNHRDFGSVSQLDDHISRNVIRDLSQAAFDIKDANLFPQAGPCTICPKRSGANTLLFADVKAPDRCFDNQCFSTKAATAFITQLQDIIETKPEVYLVRERYSNLPQAVNEYVQKAKVKILIDDTDCSDNSWSGSRFKLKAKGFFINGYDAGKIKQIYLPGKISKSGTGEETKQDTQAIVAGIKERQARFKVLDTCKIHHAIIEAVKDKPELTEKPFKFQPIDRGIMVFLLLKSAGLEHDTIKGVPDYPSGKGYHPEYFQKLSKISEESLALVIRAVVYDRFAHTALQYGVNTEDAPIRLIAEYLKVDIKAIEDAQNEIAKKRTERANQRIAVLQSVKKAPEKKKKIATPSKPAIKKAKKKK